MKTLIAFCSTCVLALSADLASQLKSDSPVWFAYSIKTEHKTDHWCEGHYRDTVHLEGSDTAAVLLRVENNQVNDLKLFSIDCTFDTGALPLIWLKDVTAEESLAYLKTPSTDNAVFAISQHAGNQATNTLIDKAKKDKSRDRREQALFWLSQRAGAKSAAAIVDAIQNDPDTEVKEKAVFALSQLPPDEGVPKLIEVARTQRNPEVREKAFFWLGQTNDPRALAYIEDVLIK